MTPEGPWIMSISGQQIWLDSSRPIPMVWPDIAMSLSQATRFGGHTPEWSVAHHSIAAHYLAPRPLRPHALLHDAEEFAVGDITRPAEMMINALAGSNIITPWKNRIRGEILIHAGLNPTLPPEIKIIDDALCYAEAVEFFGPYLVATWPAFHDWTPDTPQEMIDTLYSGNSPLISDAITGSRIYSRYDAHIAFLQILESHNIKGT
jgi:hypothetical protein